MNCGLTSVAIGELVAGCPVSVEGLQPDVVAGEVVVGCPVSVEGLPSDVGWGMSAVTTVDDDRDQTKYLRLKTAYFITCVALLGRDPEFLPVVFCVSSE